MKRINKAKRLVMQQQFRCRTVRDRTKYRRKSKIAAPPSMAFCGIQSIPGHKKAPVSGGFYVVAA